LGLEVKPIGLDDGRGFGRGFAGDEKARRRIDESILAIDSSFFSFDPSFSFSFSLSSFSFSRSLSFSFSFSLGERSFAGGSREGDGAEGADWPLLSADLAVDDPELPKKTRHDIDKLKIEVRMDLQGFVSYEMRRVEAMAETSSAMATAARLKAASGGVWRLLLLCSSSELA